MALVVEDGSTVVGANTYSDLATLRAYALERGIALSADDAALEALVHQAMDYLETFESSMRGERVDATTQELSYPRKDDTQADGLVALSNGKTIAIDAIPKELQSALGQLVIAMHQGFVANPITLNRATIAEKVGPLEERYATPNDGGGSGQVQTARAFEAALAPLLYNSAGRLRTQRI